MIRAAEVEQRQLGQLLAAWLLLKLKRQFLAIACRLEIAKLNEGKNAF